MSVDQTEVVDLIGIDEHSDDVILTISDHLEWGSGEHLLLLQEKLNTYLSFVESGEILESYSKARGRDVLINVVCKYKPDDSAISFLGKVASIVEGAGMKFKYEVFSED